MTTENPCLSCGACCAHFKVTLYWAEADDATPEGVPVDWTEPAYDLFRAMRGTQDVPPRCAALNGDVGRCVSCSIYERRPSACRAFRASYCDGRRYERCEAARAAHGLPPLEP
jgi:hypothetical protein